MISAHFARLLLRDFTQLGHSAERLLAGTQLTEKHIWSCEQLSAESFVALLDNAQVLEPTTPLGLLVGSSNRVAGLGMMGMAMYAAPTLAQGLQAMVSFSTLQAGYVHLRLFAGLPNSNLVITLSHDVGNSLATHIESVIVLIGDYLTDIVGDKRHELTFTVTYADTNLRARYHERLGGSIEFNTGLNSVALPTNWLRVASPYANADAWRVAQHHLTEQLQAASSNTRSPFTTHIREYLAAEPPPISDLSGVADALHISARTLNRRLQDEGVTFRQLRLEAVHNWAKRRLLEGSGIDAIAVQLGYDNSANFRRSFRHHVGVTPRVWLTDALAND